MNILFTTQSGGISGSTYSLLFLAKGLKEKGHKVIMAAPQNRLLQQLSVENDLPFYAVAFKPKLSRRSILAIRNIVRSEEIDIVNAQESRDRYNVIASKIFFRWRAKIILTRRQRVAGNNLFKRFIHVRFSEKIIVISHGLQQLVKKKGFPIEHTYVIHNGLPIDQYVLSKQRIGELRERYGLSEGDVVIGCVARRKRQDQLVLAMKKLPKTWKVLLVGLSRADFEERWPDLKLESVEDRVIFTGLVQDRSEVVHHYSLMTVHVLPSQMDGFGLTSLEAMAMGVPTIGSNYGGIPDVIEHDVNGFIFENDDIEQLAHQIERLVRDEILRRKFIKNGFDAALNKFSIQNTVDHYERFFRSMLES